MNFNVFTNTSNSMSPIINNGSLSVVKAQPANSYEVGDVITFYQADLQKEVTHRIYRLGGNMYVTKGDYNEAIDAQPVNPRLVIGRVIMVIPFLGYWATFIKSQIGVSLIIVLPATIIVLTELSNIFLIQKSKK
jgi:signal peptidase I